eukprot:scaffold2853_cov108-Skeletonema_marinoi.AAC.3
MSTATAKAKEIAKNPMKLMPDEPLALPSAHKAGRKLYINRSRPTSFSWPVPETVLRITFTIQVPSTLASFLIGSFSTSSLSIWNSPTSFKQVDNCSYTQSSTPTQTIFLTGTHPFCECNR